MTTKEIVKALRCKSSQEEQNACEICKRDGACFRCIGSYITNAADRLMELEQRIAESQSIILISAAKVESLERELAFEKSRPAQYEQESYSWCEKYENVSVELAAAKEDLRHNDNCDICIGSMTAHAECDLECLTCRLDCRCKDCNDENKWAWRGAQEGADHDGR